MALCVLAHSGIALDEQYCDILYIESYPLGGTHREEELIERQTRHLKRALQPLKYALEAHHRSLEELESALIEFEEALGGDQHRLERERREHLQQQEAQRGGLELLSITDVCRELGMGKSWVYRRIQSGEIPSVKLGRNIKVRREDLEGYLDRQRHSSPTTSSEQLAG